MSFLYGLQLYFGRKGEVFTFFFLFLFSTFPNMLCLSITMSLYPQHTLIQAMAELDIFI